MTEEQVKTGGAILKKIESLEKQYNDLEKFTIYITTKEDVDEIDIQIHEKWMSTPYAQVSKPNLVKFLNDERYRIRSNINSFREKLEEM